MSDIDDDLLALAGGASEDEASDGSSRDGSDLPRNSKRDASGKSRKPQRRTTKDDSEEEGEA
ncbi:hypothetical protein E4U17_004142 [Claviceps sp. LM77 group G4]|nr:hypothetical protein E4U17_004142 [Claviceps sp. LM77 group G4]KAG6070485.1 hypothetical protein E4U33_004158 [Claviceps sp. LM78 group G4]